MYGSEKPLLSRDYEDNKIEKDDIVVGMMLHAIYPSSASVTECVGYVVTEITELGFDSYDAFNNNRWFFKWKDLDTFRFFTDDDYFDTPDIGKIDFSPGYQNWVLRYRL